MIRQLKIWKMLLFFTMTGLLALSCNKGDEHTQDGAADAASAKLPVDVIVARQESLDQQEIVAGTIIPRQEVTIVSEIPQKVVRIAFNDGDMVTKGQLLYKLNDIDLRAGLKQLQAELKLAAITEKRLKNLLATETIMQQEYDEAETRWISLKAKEEHMLFQISKTEIRAPFSGRIGISKADLGTYVSPGSELVNLQDQSMISISFSVPERYLAQARKNHKVYFTTQLSEERYTAVINAVEAGVDAGNRTLKVEAFAPNPKGQLKGGMSAKIFFSVLENGTKGITIPSQALIPGENGYNVFINKEGIAKITPVKISNRTESTATIISGINDGDHLIISNIMRLGDGMPVEEVAANNQKN